MNIKKQRATTHPWPAQPVDLNPIEIVWDELDRLFTVKQATSMAHLR